MAQNWIILCILLTFFVTKGYGREKKEENIVLEAYNCDKRLPSHPLPGIDPTTCIFSEQFSSKTKYESVDLIVEKQELPITGYRCTVSLEVTFNYCGSSQLPGVTYWQVLEDHKHYFDITLTKKDCIKLTETGIFIHKQTQLDEGSNIPLNFTKSGMKIKVNYKNEESGREGLKTANGECKDYIPSGTFREHVTYENQIITLTYEANFEQVNLIYLVGPGTLQWRKVMNVEINEEGIYSSMQGTFVYEFRDFECKKRFTKKRFLDATIVRKKEDRRVLLSNDGRAMTFIHNGTTEVCGGNVTKTDTASVYICPNCEIKLEEASPTNEYLFTLLGLNVKSSQTMMTQIYNKNFLIISDRVCELQVFLLNKYPDFLLNKYLDYRRDFHYFEKYGVAHYKDCDRVLVTVDNTRTNCYDRLPVIHQRNFYFIDWKTQEIRNEAREIKCSGNDTRFRGVSDQHKTVDICGGPRYRVCTLPGHNITLNRGEIESGLASQFLNVFSSSQITKFRRKKRGKLIPRKEDEINESRRPDTSEENRHLKYMKKLFKAIVEEVREFLYNIPYLGGILNFLFSFDEREKLTVLTLIITGVEMCQEILKEKRFKWAFLAQAGIALYSPLVFILLKLYQVELEDKFKQIQYFADRTKERFREDRRRGV